MVDLAARVVVMTQTAGDRLSAGYAIDPAKVVLIPHGATPPFVANDMSAPGESPLQLLTWGLLGPGKGIEHVIDALHLLGVTSAARSTTPSPARPTPRCSPATVTCTATRSWPGHDS